MVTVIVIVNLALAPCPRRRRAKNLRFRWGIWDDRWLAQHPSVHFHYTPTHASWLNQIEVWFSILTRSVLRHLSATDPKQACQAIDRFTNVSNQNPTPFEWTKSVVKLGSLKPSTAPYAAIRTLTVEAA